MDLAGRPSHTRCIRHPFERDGERARERAGIDRRSPRPLHCRPPQVYKTLGDPSEEEMDMLDLAFDLTDTSRLGCQARSDRDTPEIWPRSARDGHSDDARLADVRSRPRKRLRGRRRLCPAAATTCTASASHCSISETNVQHFSPPMAAHTRRAALGSVSQNSPTSQPPTRD